MPRVYVRLDDKPWFDFSIELISGIKYGGLFSNGTALSMNEVFNELITVYSQQFPDQAELVERAFEIMRKDWNTKQ